MPELSVSRMSTSGAAVSMPATGDNRRWWVLATVVAAQFMFGVDAFIVNVAIPTIAIELHASAAENPSSQST